MADRLPYPWELNWGRIPKIVKGLFAPKSDPTEEDILRERSGVFGRAIQDIQESGGGPMGAVLGAHSSAIGASALGKAGASGRSALGSIGGVKAQGAPLHTLDKAMDMKGQKISAPKIFKETGWYRGKDNMWRFEFPDAVVTPDWGLGDTLGDVYRQNLLFEHYPELARTPVDIKSLPEGVDMRMLAPRLSSRRIEVSPAAAMDLPNAGHKLAHEGQHGIQGIEGFAGGGSSVGNDVMSDVALQPYFFPYWHRMRASGYGPKDSVTMAAKEVYKRLLGETEARAVQAQFGKSPDMIARHPWFTRFDIPYAQQIVKQ